MKFFVMTFIVFSACTTQMSSAADQKNAKTSDVACTKVEQTAEFKNASVESKANSGEQAKVTTVKAAEGG